MLILLVLCGAGYFTWKWYFQKSDSMDGFRLIPDNAVFVVQTDEPIEGWKKFSSSEIWQHIKKYPPLGEVGKDADKLSEMVDDHNLIFRAFGHRNVLISAHVVNSLDYDFLYVCDMEEGAKFSTVKDGIVDLCKEEGFSYTQAEISGIPTHSFFDPKDKSTLNLAFVANQLVCSYNADIFKNSLHQSHDSAYTPDTKFTEIAATTATNGLCRIFLNHKNIPGFLNVYMDDISDMKTLFASMDYTGAIAEMDKDKLSFQGYTGIQDSMGSYLRALYRSGASKTGAPAVLSEKTAFMMSLGFQSFAKFYENLKDVMKEDEKAWKEFNSNKKFLEKILRFRLEEDLMGWIDDEVCLAQYQQERVIGAKVHTLAAIRALSEEKAQDKLGMLKKRLSLLGKFKTEKYRDVEINYIEIRGLFKLLFGKLFDKIQKPYYAIINGYVLFCDDPATLLKTIDDIKDGKTLSQNEEYDKFQSGFKKENSMLAYVNMKKYFLNLKGILDAPSYSSSYSNREFIICFKHMGFQFSREENYFDTRMLVQFEKPDEAAMEIAEGHAMEQGELEAGDSMSAADVFILQYINGSVRKEEYDNGKSKILAEMKDGVMHGKYLEYWENGNIKSKGHYKNGEKSGLWFYYTEVGDLDKKERFGKAGVLDTILEKTL